MSKGCGELARGMAVQVQPMRGGNCRSRGIGGLSHQRAQTCRRYRKLWGQ